METIAIIQGERESDSRYILKVKPTGFAGLICERKERGEKDHLKVYGLSTCTELPLLDGEDCSGSRTKPNSGIARMSYKGQRGFYLKGNWASGVPGSDLIRSAVNSP